MIITNILDSIMDRQGDFEILQFMVGKKKTDNSYAKIRVIGKTEEHLDTILSELFRLGATSLESQEVKFQKARKDMVLPDDFYSTTNHPTLIYLEGRWVQVENLMMDKQIIIEPDKSRAYCKPIRLVKKGDLVVIGEAGIRIIPPERPREGGGLFEFMASNVSPEKPSTFIVKRVAEDLYQAKKRKEKVVLVAGPAIVHTGASPHLAKMIKMGFVDVLLSGNALAVHDVEYSLFGTSLGVNIETGSTRRESRNHIAAINEILKEGSLRDLVDSGKLSKGIFYQCIVNNVPYALASSIRDDGPIPDVIQNLQEAQKQYMNLVKDAEFVIMMASTLHSIAVGNMLASNVKTICIDINPAVVIKLSDRGTSQAIGIVSDVGTFLPLLVEELEKQPNINANI
jgi:lysine-ketoglutarate reductase/saccharopine dehydrogenase-like protein (TIGR00300 family)